MKKKLLSVFALFGTAAMLLSACSSNENQPVTGDKDAGDSGAVIENQLVTKGTGAGNGGTVTIESGDTYAVISVENYGDIKVKLYPDEAPVGVQNFIDLANSGYYTGKNIHRVISDFMLQGGSLNGDGTGGTSADGGEFSCEINTSMRHYYGALCYANAGGSNTCQFYIVNNKEPQTDISAVYDQYANYYSQYAEAYTNEAKNYEDNNAEYYEYFISSGEAYKNMSDGAKAMSETLTDEISAKYAEVGGTPFLDGGYTVFGQTVEGFDVIDAISAVETEAGSDGAESKPVTDIIISSVTIHTAE